MLELALQQRPDTSTLVPERREELTTEGGLDVVSGRDEIRRVARALRDAMKPDGLNVMQANGAAAFQSVPHLHLHLIPRFIRDGKGFDWQLVPGNRDEILANAEKIRAALGGK
jgi:hypothetical protein